MGFKGSDPSQCPVGAEAVRRHRDPLDAKERALNIGFIGSGNIGQRLAVLGQTAGYAAIMSNSRGPDSLHDLADSLGARAATVEEAMDQSDFAVFSIPFNRLREVDPTPFEGKIVLDTTNYYPMRDGQIPALDEYSTTTSEMVQEHLVGARVVKAFNAIMARDLVAPFGLPGARRALPIAADEGDGLGVASEFHERIGFDAVEAGSLAESWRFERAKPCYCIPLDRAGLVAALAQAERDVELPHNSWKRDD
jgi:predicted dinucleotide-binding enzyme